MLPAFFALLAGSRGKMRVRWSNGMEPTATAKEDSLSLCVWCRTYVVMLAPHGRQIDGTILEHDPRPNPRRSIRIWEENGQFLKSIVRYKVWG